MLCCWYFKNADVRGGGGLKIQKNVDKGDGPYVTYIFMSIFMGQGTEVTQVLKDSIKIMKDNLSSSFF